MLMYSESSVAPLHVQSTIKTVTVNIIMSQVTLQEELKAFFGTYDSTVIITPYFTVTSTATHLDRQCTLRFHYLSRIYISKGRPL